MSIFATYNTFKYLYPPRAENAMQPDELKKNSYDAWIAQPKYNGSCAVLFIDGRNAYQLYDRHKDKLTLQRPLDYTALNDSNEYMVLCGEYLNKNKKGENGQPFNHKFIIWDIIVHKGKYLIGKTVEERIDLLHELFGSSRGVITDKSLSIFDHLIATKVTDVYLAPSYTSKFARLYTEIVDTDLYEGIVLKRANAPLEIGMKEKNNTTWQVKIRKPTKNYNF